MGNGNIDTNSDLIEKFDHCDFCYVSFKIVSPVFIEINYVDDFNYILKLYSHWERVKK